MEGAIQTSNTAFARFVADDDIERHGVNKRFSTAMAHGGLVYITGQVGGVGSAPVLLEILPVTITSNLNTAGGGGCGAPHTVSKRTTQLP